MSGTVWAVASENIVMLWNRWGANMLRKCWTTVVKVSIQKEGKFCDANLQVVKCKTVTDEVMSFFKFSCIIRLFHIIMVGTRELHNG